MNYILVFGRTAMFEVRVFFMGGSIFGWYRYLDKKVKNSKFGQFRGEFTKFEVWCKKIEGWIGSKLEFEKFGFFGSAQHYIEQCREMKFRILHGCYVVQPIFQMLY